MLWVWVVREIFNSRACASAGRASKPMAVVSDAPDNAACKKPLRDRSMA